MRMVIILRSLFVFQFTRPRGARRNPHHTTDRLAQFQFTRPRGARLETRKRILGHTEVSIHAPTGGATAASDKDGTRRICFNSRAHGGRDSIAYETAATTCEFQFTRPRGARLLAARLARRRDVSIHAPTGGATVARDPRVAVMAVSIHAPTGGATNSRLVTIRHGFVSIHAPTGGATKAAEYEARMHGFNSRAHGGRDVNTMVCSPLAKFQFTRPQGARLPILYHIFTADASFNSRAHGGRD